MLDDTARSHNYNNPCFMARDIWKWTTERGVNGSREWWEQSMISKPEGIVRCLSMVMYCFRRSIFP
jgi:hypothetical protein